MIRRFSEFEAIYLVFGKRSQVVGPDSRYLGLLLHILPGANFWQYTPKKIIRRRKKSKKSTSPFSSKIAFFGPIKSSGDSCSLRASHAFYVHTPWRSALYPRLRLCVRAVPPPRVCNLEIVQCNYPRPLRPASPVCALPIVPSLSPSTKVHLHLDSCPPLRNWAFPTINSVVTQRPKNWFSRCDFWNLRKILAWHRWFFFWKIFFNVFIITFWRSKKCQRNQNCKDFQNFETPEHFMF